MGYILWPRPGLTLCLLFMVAGMAKSLDLDTCDFPLGMESFEIPDEAITASSSYDQSVSAKNGRIRTEKDGGAWCPLAEVSRDVYEYIQIDLGRLRVITMVETQGRFGGGQGQEFADQYKVEYQREENGRWFLFKNRRGRDIFEGNSNTYTMAMSEIDPPIIARTVRIVPYSAFPKVVCMRVELFGCDWNDNLVSYSMPQGHRRGVELEFTDYIYDGFIKDAQMSGGLGQLTDGMYGESNFRGDPSSSGHKGYDWLGWRNDSMTENQPLEMVFRFKSVRNFTMMRIHSNNMFSKEIRIFRMAKIYSSIGGVYYNSPPLVYKYMRDDLIQLDRLIEIKMDHMIGKYLRVELYFDAKWILISEVEFMSEMAQGVFVEETEPEIHPPSSEPSGEDTKTLIKDTLEKSPEIDIITAKNLSSVKPGAVAPTRRVPGQNSGDVGYISESGLSEETIGIIIGTLTIFIIILIVVFILLCLRSKRRKDAQMKGTSTSPYNDLTLGVTNLKLVNGYNYVTSSDVDSEKEVPVCCNGEADYYNGEEFQQRKLPELPKTPESTDTNPSRDYAVPDQLKNGTLLVNGSFKAQTLGRRSSSHRHVPQSLGYHPNITGTYPYAGGAHYASSTLPSIQGVTGNNVYAAPGNLDLMWRDDPQLIEFDKDHLTLVEKLGEGQFGEVHLCEAGDVTNLLGDDFLVNRTGSRSMLVAVKMLRPDVGEQARLDFQKEVKIMCQLRDPNIVQVLGVCNREDFLCVVVEYMKYGDLTQFLQKHCLEGMPNITDTITPLSYGCLIYMATQIASGMKYLESLNMVHRDLASRNCLVGNLYTIKISDFGMSRSLYSSDYYRIEGKAVLPIRWMSWESVLLGKFSSKSDVWSFAVTMWEILTFCREQPYNNLTDDHVIENCGHFYRKDGLESYLQQPLYCPKEIYDLMCECWNQDETFRPAFKEIHMFLQRKNMGYTPMDEKTMYGGATNLV